MGLYPIPYFLKSAKKYIASHPTEITTLRNSLITTNAWLKKEIDTLRSEMESLIVEINAQQLEIANEASNERNWDDSAEVSATQDLRRLPWEALATSLNVIKGSSLYIAGTAYQVVDSTLFNSVTELTKIFGTDINSIPSHSFQLGRQTGNNAVTAVAIVAMTGWGGAGAAWATAAITGTAICAGTLAWGGVILFPCAVEIGTASAVAAGWAAVASYGWVMYAISSKNQADIQKAVEGARWSATKTVGDITKSLVGKYKNLQCKEFASDLRKLLDKEGVLYKEVEVHDVYKRWLVSTDAKKIFPESRGTISTNGNHYATRVWDTIYDNVHPQWISLKGFKDDIGITEYPQGFTDLKWLD